MEPQCFSNKQNRIIIDYQPKDLFYGENTSFLFEERALLLAQENDIVILRKDIPDLYLKFLQSICNFKLILLESPNYTMDLIDVLKINNNLIKIKNMISLMDNKFDLLIHAYIPNKKVLSISNILNIPILGFNFYNDNYRKEDTTRICENLGLQTIPSVSVTKTEDLSNEKVKDFIKSNKHIIIKPNIGLGGQSILLEDILKYFERFPLNSIVIQRKLNLEIEGSIQFFKSFNKWYIYYCKTFQKNNKFIGFKYPFKNNYLSELQDTANKFLNYFINNYNNDIPSFGIDFFVSNKILYFHDINPRNTGITYIFSLLSNLYGTVNLMHLQFYYIQLNLKNDILFSEIIAKLNNCEINQISNENKEGYAVIYPTMLEKKIINILFVSETNKIDYYLNKIITTINIYLAI